NGRSSLWLHVVTVIAFIEQKMKTIHEQAITKAIGEGSYTTSVGFADYKTFEIAHEREDQYVKDAELQNEKDGNKLVKPVVTIMDSVQAYYLENAHSGQVLVIEGETLNESSDAMWAILSRARR